MIKYEVIDKGQKEYTHFNRDLLKKTVEIKHNFGKYKLDLAKISEEVDDMYENIVVPVLQKYSENDYHSIVISNKDLNLGSIFLGI